MKFAEAYARVYDRLRNREEADPDEARAYADVFIELYGFYDSYKYVNPDHYAEDYTDAYLGKLSEGKSHDYALAYADCKTGNCRDLDFSKLAASYASQRELGKSKAYAYVYSIVRAEDKSPDEAQDLAERYETAYNDLIANGKTHAYARRYAYVHVVSGWEREAAAEAKWSEQGYRPYVTVSAGNDHTCGVLEGGRAACWGSDSSGQSSPPDGKFIAISAGGHHTCGVLEGGRPACWGSDSSGRSSPPDGKFIAIGAGEFHTCGVLEGGQAACWGSDEHGKASPPDGEFIAISAGYDHTCGVLEGGRAACWGDNYSYRQSSPPDGKFIAISAGGHHTCGVLEGGRPACWGTDSSGRSSPPDGKFIAISAGQDHTCGVLEGGRAACWGSDNDGQASPPDGKFIAISAGQDHTCGVLEGGRAACWGSNYYGQLGPPPNPVELTPYRA